MSNPRKIAVSLFLSALLVSAGIASASVKLADPNTTSLSSGLVGYWPLDGNTTSWLTDTTQDVSGNGNTGQLIGMSTTTSPVAGKIGQALLFKTSSTYIQASGLLGGATQFTESAWIKFSSIPDGFPSIINRGSAGLWDGSIFLDEITSSSAKAGVQTGGTWTPGNTTLQAGNWYLIAATYNGSTVRLYVNGAQDGSYSYSSALSSQSNTIIGGVPAWAFNGVIDDVRIYNRALSAQEVQQLYKLGSATVDHSNTVTLATGLVGYWPLDGNTTSWTTDTTQDVSGNGNTGQLIGMSTSTSPVPGKIGGALKFNGTSSYVDAGAASTLHPLTVTASAWVRTKSTSTAQQVLRGAGEFYGYSLNIGVVSGDASFYIRTTTDNELDTAIDTNWHLITGTYDGTTQKLYRDGVLVASHALTGNPTYDGANLNIGRRGGSSQDLFMKGNIDDVRIYNRALSAQEVQQLYKTGTATVDHSNTVTLQTGLVGYWPFDGNTTSWKTDTTQDMSGNGNTGSLINMSTTTSPVAGKIGGALKFNGSSSHINAGTSGLPMGSAPISTYAWIYIPSAAPVHAVIVGLGTSNINFEAVVLELNGKFGGGFHEVSVDNGGSSFGSSLIPSVGSWHFVGYTYAAGASSVTIYLDGASQSVLIGSPLNVVTPGAGLIIGGPLKGYDTYFNGNIDDVRVYSRALSAQEVAQLYAAGR